MEFSALVDAAKLQRILTPGDDNKFLPDVDVEKLKLIGDLYESDYISFQQGDDESDKDYNERLGDWKEVTADKLNGPDGIMEKDKAYMASHGSVSGYVRKILTTGNSKIYYRQVTGFKENNFKIQHATGTYAGMPVIKENTGPNYSGARYATASNELRYDNSVDYIGDFFNRLSHDNIAKIGNDESMKNGADRILRNLESTLNERIDEHLYMEKKGGSNFGSREADGRLRLFIGPLKKQWSDARYKYATHQALVNRLAILADKVSTSTKNIAATCGSSSSRKRSLRSGTRRLDKRAGCIVVPQSIIPEDGLDLPGTHDDVMREEIGAIRDMGQALGIPQMGLGYTGEGVPRDRNDNTELDHKMVFAGSADIDQAIFLMKEAVLSKIAANKQSNPKLASAVSRLDKAFKMRVANMLRDRNSGLVTPDKGITAQGRSEALNEIRFTYKDATGKTTEQDDPDNAAILDVNDNGDSVFGLDTVTELSVPDTRPDSDLVSIYEADTIRSLNYLSVDSSSESTRSEPTVKENDVDNLSVSSMSPGSKDYVGMWANLRDKTVTKLLTKGAKFQRWERRVFRGAMGRWKQAIDKKEKILQEKRDSGKELTASEINDYEMHHDAYTMVYERARILDEGLVGSEDRQTDSGIPDKGFVEKLSTKVTFATRSGQVSKYNRGIRGILDTARRFGGRLLSMGRGTKKNGKI